MFKNQNTGNVRVLHGDNRLHTPSRTSLDYCFPYTDPSVASPFLPATLALTNSFPALFKSARRPIPRMSTYTSTIFRAVPVMRFVFAAACGPYLRSSAAVSSVHKAESVVSTYLWPMASPIFWLPTSSNCFVESSSVVQMRSAERINLSRVPIF